MFLFKTCSASTLLISSLLVFPAIASAQEDADEDVERSEMPEGGATHLPVAEMPYGHDHTDGDESDEHPSLTASGLKYQLDGYLRILAEVVDNDALPFIGRNDGFRIGNARIGNLFRYKEMLSAYISLEAALAQADSPNDPNAELTVGVRDAYLELELAKPASVRLGRFKTPYDVGALESTRDRVFVESPLETRGVERTHGLELDGMTQDRQIGLMIHSDRIGLSNDGFDLGYAVAVTNGRTEGLVLNDNEEPAGFVRLSGHYGDYVTVNVGGFLDDRTVGELPNLFEEDVKGVEGSLILRIEGLRVEGQILYQTTDFVTSGRPTVDSMGFHGQWSYRLWGFEAAYRFAWFDPNTDFDVDRVSEHTLGLSYFFDELPLRLALNGTIPDEERELDNNRVTFLSQLRF